ncbi:MAG: hypothetical protein AVDCRST_MAG23-229, partial [uncultured Sphingosinicella sp.]
CVFSFSPPLLQRRLFLPLPPRPNIGAVVIAATTANISATCVRPCANAGATFAAPTAAANTAASAATAAVICAKRAANIAAICGTTATAITIAATATTPPKAMAITPLRDMVAMITAATGTAIAGTTAT